MSKEQHKRGQFSHSKKDILNLLGATESMRDRVILELMVYSGLRREEVCSIQKAAIDRQKQRIRIQGKGNKYRSVPVRKDVLCNIDAYLKNLHRKYNKSPWLFPAVNKKGCHLVPIQVNRICARAGKKAGIKPNPSMKTVHPHSFRHTFARILKKKGVEITVIKEVMGHKDIRTTQESYGLPSVNEIHKKVLDAIA